MDEATIERDKVTVARAVAFVHGLVTDLSPIEILQNLREMAERRLSMEMETADDK